MTAAQPPRGTWGPYNDEEKEQAARHILWTVGDPRGYRPGSFTEKLLETWAQADVRNKAKLSRAFPSLGDALDVLWYEKTEGLVEWAGIK